MRTNDVAPVAALHAALDALAAQDPGVVPPISVRHDLRELLSATNRLHAELTRRVASFDANGSSVHDGFRTTRDWLRAFGRLSQAGAARLVRGARLLRELPKLADAAARGAVSAEHVYRVERLAERVGIETVRRVEAPLTELASWVDSTTLARACDRVRCHVDRGGPRPDPGADFDRRGITLSPLDGMVVVRGQLDPEGGATLQTALDSLMRPPGPGDDRRPAQRRADALVELARRAMREGRLPRVSGVLPQVGILLSPENLITPEDLPAPPDDLPLPEDSPSHGEGLAEHGRSGWRGGPGRAGARLGRRPPGRPGPTRPGPPGPAPAGAASAGPAGPAGNAPTPARPGSTQRPMADAVQIFLPPRAGLAVDHPSMTHQPGSSAPRQGRPGTGDPLGAAGVDPAPPRASLDGVGDVPDEVGQRLACDSEVWRLVLDPATREPLEMGRAHRVVPDSLRKALHARDGGCRFPGCDAPPAWTDAHHLRSWARGGRTDLDNLILLCRHHHGLVHEGGWTISRDSAGGPVIVYRPDGGAFTLFDPPHH
jgi:hypothetical protein